MSIDNWVARHVDASGPCWLWLGAKKGPYGNVGAGTDGSTTAHRYVWERLVGPIPKDHQLDHLCRVTLCVNPDHCEPVVPAENMRRTRRHRCGQGHDLTDPANYRVDARGTRVCRPCRATNERRKRAALRQG
jgi:hypothetical protein